MEMPTSALTGVTLKDMFDAGLHFGILLPVLSSILAAISSFLHGIIKKFLHY